MAVQLGNVAQYYLLDLSGLAMGKTNICLSLVTCAASLK